MHFLIFQLPYWFFFSAFHTHNFLSNMTATFCFYSDTLEKIYSFFDELLKKFLLFSSQPQKLITRGKAADADSRRLAQMTFKFCD